MSSITQKQPNVKACEQGFTLIEILVSTAIFIIVISALATSLSYVIKLQRRTNALRTANDNVRYITDFFSKEIRNGTPTFNTSAAVLPGCGYYAGFPDSYTQNWFQLVNVSGDNECIFLSANGITANTTGPGIWITKQPSGSASVLPAQQLNTGTAQITSLTFTIASQSSSSVSYSNDQQPYVIIKGTVVANTDPQNIVTIPFESSISILDYGLPIGSY